jgi:hypothetical protein
MNRVVHIDPTMLEVLLSTILPLIVALVTNRFASGIVKTGTLIVLSVATGVLSQLAANDGTFVVGHALADTGLALLIAIGAHFGVWKPVGISGSAGVIARVFPAGIGSDVTPSA